MKYNNPVIKGFYPDPSVCKVGDTFYLVCSSMHYFPGVPLFESKDLVNWKQIGHCLTRKSQIELDKVDSSGGVFAPTIRYHEGRFYMTTTNATLQKNFYVWTDNIYGEWSEPIFVDQDGIDPSFYFENDKAYFMSNGTDEDGINGIVQCEIDIKTGIKLSKSRCIWQGTGGRYLESPHLYRINDEYYLMAAEGGTEYGHMVTYARSKSAYGEFTPYSNNPVLTNRNLGGYEVQGVGHGDLIEDNNGNWWILHLGFRQIHRWLTFHHLGREVFLTPVKFDENGWFTAGDKGTTTKSFILDDIPTQVEQKETKSYTFDNTSWDKEWCHIRLPHYENYKFEQNRLLLRGTEITLDHVDSPTFLGIRQMDFKADITCDIQLIEGEAGITLFMDENHHYDLAIRKKENGYEVIERLNIGDIKSVEQSFDLKLQNKATLIVKAENEKYRFYVQIEEEPIYLGSAQTRYVSTEVANGFTGVIIGLYATGTGIQEFAEFTKFNCEYYS
ncbi:MAG: glycoside hydrolase family 43 protein [Mobilitalea sp.]